MPRGEVRKLMFWKCPVILRVDGPLHATSPQNLDGVGYMLARQPGEAELEDRQAVGEPITPLSDLKKEVEEAVGATEEAPQRCVFRREGERPYLHHNFFKGHLRDSGEALSRALNFWGLQQFVTRTLFIRPEKIFLPEGCEVRVDRWPAHFDPYRGPRMSAFREAEMVESPKLEFSVLLVNDPRWNQGLLEELFQYGSLHGIGGGRGRGMGQYRYELSELELIPPRDAWQG